MASFWHRTFQTRARPGFSAYKILEFSDFQFSKALSHSGSDLSNSQFRFRRERSTVDAVMRLASLRAAAVARGRVLLAVRLDITNAFNALSWHEVVRSLDYLQVPSASGH